MILSGVVLILPSRSFLAGLEELGITGVEGWWVEGKMTWVEVDKSVLDARVWMEMLRSSTRPEQFIFCDESGTEFTGVLEVDPSMCVSLWTEDAK